MITDLSMSYYSAQQEKALFYINFSLERVPQFDFYAVSSRRTTAINSGHKSLHVYKQLIFEIETFHTLIHICIYSPFRTQVFLLNIYFGLRHFGNDNDSKLIKMNSANELEFFLLKQNQK